MDVLFSHSFPHRSLAKGGPTSLNAAAKAACKAAGCESKGNPPTYDPPLEEKTFFYQITFPRVYCDLL